MLFKNVYRTLKKQYVQLLLLGFIITSSSFIYTTMAYGIGDIKGPAGEYFELANQEDFAISMKDYMDDDDISYVSSTCSLSNPVFTLSLLKDVDSECYNNLVDYRLTKITNEFDNIDIELREYKDVFFDFNDSSHRARFLKDNDRINLSFIVEGVTPSNNSEIAVGKTYAKVNDLSIGDSIKIENKDYTISGFALFPDYSLAILSVSMIFDNETQTLALLSDEEFENISTSVNFHIGGVFTNGTSSNDFETNVMDKYKDIDELNFISNIVFTENNMRSGGVYADIEGAQATGAMLSIIISSIAILIVGIMVSKILQSQRGQIGILKSIGYRNSEITIPYIFFIAILSLPALILGYFLGYISSEPLKNQVLKFYLLPSIEVSQTLSSFIIAVVVPLFFILFVGYFIIKYILSRKPVTLLNPIVTSSGNFLTKFMGRYLKRLNITNKLKHLLLYRNIVKFGVFMIGMFFAAFLILLSFSMMGVMGRTINDYYDNADYNYVGYCKYETVCDLPTGTQEKVIELPSAIFNDEEVSLVGINTNSSLHKLYDMRGNDITKDLNEGVIITQSLKLLKGFSVGDSILVEAGENTVTLEIVGITKEYTGDKAYLDIDNLSIMLTENTGYYNAIYSEDELDPSNYILVISNDDIVDQAETMANLFNTITQIMIVSSILIGGIIIYILTVLTIEDNFYNISLFKVIGYNNKEIDKMIIGGYLLYGIIIFVVAMPIGYFTFIGMQMFMAKFYNLVMPFEFKLWHGILSLVIYIVIYYIGAYVAKKKLRKISLQEAMKMYQI